MASVVETTSSRPRDDSLAANGPIIIATDGRPECAAALAAGRILAARLSTDFQVVAAYQPLAPLVPDPRLLLDHGLMARVRGDLTARVRKQCGLPPGDKYGLEAPHLEVLEGEPPKVIAAVADERDAQLIVLGLGRHDILERVFGDETALQVVRTTHVPVLAVPDRDFGAPRSAIVGIDFSEMSLRAAQAALRLLDAGAVLRLVYVVPRTRTVLDDVIPREEEERYVRHRFTQFVGRLTVPAGIAVGEVTLDGDPARELLRYAEETGTDFVAVGSHGHGFMERMVVGSVTTKLLRGAHCGVLVVPPLRPSRAERATVARALTMRFDETRWAEGDQFRRMFGDFPTPSFVTPLGWAPAIDITEGSEEVTVKAELPGVKKNDLKVMYDDGMLTIQGEKHEEKKDETKQHHVYERSYGSFARSFTLPNTIDDRNIKAEFDDGVLTVHLPKTADARKSAKHIEITG